MMTSTSFAIDSAYHGHRMKRFLAFFVDMFSVTLVVLVIYRQWNQDYDSVMESFIADPSDTALRDQVMAIQNKIGMYAGGIYLIYSFLMEASNQQATFGKQLFRLKVIHTEGRAITPKEALWRNAFKVVSQAVLNMGFFWILFDKQKRGWHDIIGKTLVVDRSYENQSPEHFAETIDIISATAYPYALDTHNDTKALSDGNQSNLLFPANMDLPTFQAHKADNTTPQERFNNYRKTLLHDVLDDNPNITDDVFWNNMSRGQKLLNVFCTFEHHMEDKGLNAFLDNHESYIPVLMEVFETLGCHHIQEHFNKILECLSQNSSIDLLILHFSEYYHTPEVKENIYEDLCKYIENRTHLFF